MCFFRTTFYIKNVDWIHNPVTFNLNPPSNWSFDLKYDWFWCLHQVIAATFPDHYSLKPPEGTIFPTGVKKLCINLKSTYAKPYQKWPWWAVGYQLEFVQKSTADPAVPPCLLYWPSFSTNKYSLQSTLYLLAWNNLRIS